MSKRMILTALFFVNSVFAQNACEKNKEHLQGKIRRSFDKLWLDVDSKVGVEFFLVVFKGNDRMPSSELSDSEYYSKLLKGMRKTSCELADSGLKLDDKKVKNLEELIDNLHDQEDCGKVAVK